MKKGDRVIVIMAFREHIGTIVRVTDKGMVEVTGLAMLWPLEKVKKF